MKGQTFDNLWETKIRPELKALKPELKKARRRGALIGVGGVSFLLFANLVKFYPIPWLLITLFILMVVSGIIAGQIDASFQADFKKTAISSLSELALYDWYIDAGHTKESEFPDEITVPDGEEVLKESGLYGQFYKVRTRDVLVAMNEGSIVASVYQITFNAEFITKKIAGSRVSGFLVRFDIGRNLEGKTYILAESDSFSEPGHTSFSKINSDDVIETELEWKEFEELLKISSSNPIEAREILTPDYMETLYRWWKNHQSTHPRLGFKGQYGYAVLPSFANLRTNIFSGIPDQQKGTMREIYQLIQTIESSISVLKQGNS